MLPGPQRFSLLQQGIKMFATAENEGFHAIGDKGGNGVERNILKDCVRRKRILDFNVLQQSCSGLCFWVQLSAEPCSSPSVTPVPRVHSFIHIPLTCDYKERGRDIAQQHNTCQAW